MLTEAFINKIATAVPPYDVHRRFIDFGRSLLVNDERRSALFDRMVERAEIEHRFSYLSPTLEADRGGMPATEFYTLPKFPTTGARMKLFEQQAPMLAEAAIAKLDLGEDRRRLTHILISCCTGFSAPGLDLEIMARCGLPGSMERSIIGFMGCYAAMNTLKLARHIVRSEPAARVLVLNLELCSLHLKESATLDEILSFLIFGDGCAASIVSSEPVGLALDSFRAVLVPETADLITWNIGDFGFDMVLSGQVPGAIQEALRTGADEILAGAPVSAIDLWAVHPGGRSVLDAVERAFDLRGTALSASRNILRRFGNMSSATVMFVLQSMLRASAGTRGCAMSFGPGLIAETMLFHGTG
ncbi:MAG TPA: type III polyketide synthase [Micropepsaceae bacterium]|jgi:predicted naringenin-chalcone synthase|nr:type III polyketide synthase [Micropepsaceae bacterium]